MEDGGRRQDTLVLGLKVVTCTPRLGFGQPPHRNIRGLGSGFQTWRNAYTDTEEVGRAILDLNHDRKRGKYSY